LIGGGFDFQSLEFAPDGTLFTARNSLHTVDPTTGLETLVGSGGYFDVRGIAFVPDVDTVPVPGTLGLLGLGLLAGCAVRRP
jgi:hypothetical protein